MFAWVIPLLNAIAAIPKIGEYVEKLTAAIALWHLGRVNEGNAQAIADAAAFANHAKTREDKYEASRRWTDALSRKRPGSGVSGI